MASNPRKFQLLREGDRVFLRFAGGGDRRPVRLAWTRPLSARGGQVSIIGDDKKEVLLLDSLDSLDSDSRAVAEEELAKRYLIPRITRVLRTSADFGMRYLQVETDLGPRHFALKHASKNAVWITDDHLMLRDTLGCRYEIRPFSALDQRSRAEIEKVI